MSAKPAGKNALTEKESFGLYLACAALMVAILYLDLQLPLGIAVAILYSGVVLLSLWSTNRKFILVVAIVASLFTIGPLFHKPPIADMGKAAANRGLALFSLWVACYLGLQKQVLEEKRANMLTEREKALEEARVLRGFLPICAACKRIRDYQGSWTLLEKYLSEHSEAEFSHGLCPDCTQKLFPDLFHKTDD
jgi:hypothetical protein